MQIIDARRAVWAAIECGDVERARTLLVEYESVYPEGGAELRDEVNDAYPHI
jgi:hypothetical protein